MVRNQKILHVETHATGLTPDAPHAHHIHFGAQAHHECPTLAIGTGTAKEIADAVREGKSVVVIHGIDYDGSKTYSFSQPQGASELDPSLPAEATDPVSCGVLK